MVCHKHVRMNQNQKLLNCNNLEGLNLAMFHRTAAMVLMTPRISNIDVANRNKSYPNLIFVRQATFFSEFLVVVIFEVIKINCICTDLSAHCSHCGCSRTSGVTKF